MLAIVSASSAEAASLSDRDLQVLGRALAFIRPPPDSVAIVYAAGNAASRHDAEELAAAIGGGIPGGTSVLRPNVVDTASLAGSHYGLVIAAVGANGPALRDAMRSSRSFCVTADVDAVQAGLCTMSIRSDPRVEIVVNHTAAVAIGAEFTAAFRMMIREM